MVSRRGRRGTGSKDAKSASRTLVAYYSRTGNTRRVARALAAATGAELEEIGDRTDRGGILGYLQSAIEAILGASTEIDRPTRDAARYELVIVGTPVWFAAVSTPVRTYLRLVRDRLPKVAFFLTHGGSGSGRALAQMFALAGKRPAGRLVLREAEVESGAYHEKVAGFARVLRRRVDRRRVPRGASPAGKNPSGGFRAPAGP
jgi:flavodoxin